MCGEKKGTALLISEDGKLYCYAFGEIHKLTISKGVDMSADEKQNLRSIGDVVPSEPYCGLDVSENLYFDEEGGEL